MINEQGIMVVRSSDKKNPTRTTPVTVRSISCEGVGVLLPDMRFPLERLATVVVQFKLGTRQFDLPGVVVWRAPIAPQRPSFDVGIRFTLAALTTDARLAYAHSVVNFLRTRGT
jgi:hypothetical protein